MYICLSRSIQHVAALCHTSFICIMLRYCIAARSRPSSSSSAKLGVAARIYMHRTPQCLQDSRQVPQDKHV